jgi:hypothetical protein
MVDAKAALKAGNVEISALYDVIRTTFQRVWYAEVEFLYWRIITTPTLLM